MKRISLIKYEIISTLFIIVLGTILHFTYKLSNSNPIIGIISSTNESTWEHLKLAFIPSLITTIIGSILYKDKYYICNKTKGIILSLMCITIFFYTYTGIIGKNYGVINILSFIICIITGQIYSFININRNNKCSKIYNYILVILCILFITFTFITPHINLFLDPITNKYGI